MVIRVVSSSHLLKRFIMSASPAATATTMWPSSPLPSSNKRILVPIADGTEEIEFSSLVGTFRRANLLVDVAFCRPHHQHHDNNNSNSPDFVVKGSRQVSFVVNKLVEDCVDTEYDAIVLPGGTGGAENLRDTPALITMLKNQSKKQKLYGAICASPAIALAHHQLLGNQATCHPSVASKLIGKVDLLKEGMSNEEAAAAIRNGPRVVFDRTHNVITSVGPGSAVEYALHIVLLLLGEETARKVADMMLPSSGSFSFAKL
jgi:4-methyl-5(b-hydroxyethyl)-thiazole monophosphate biosynthesis